MLQHHGDWMALGSADEQRPAAAGTVEAWSRASDHPVGSWYRQRKGFRGLFAMYIPPSWNCSIAPNLSTVPAITVCVRSEFGTGLN